jgi:hypothetical protein
LVFSSTTFMTGYLSSQVRSLESWSLKASAILTKSGRVSAVVGRRTGGEGEGAHVRCGRKGRLLIEGARHGRVFLGGTRTKSKNT